MKKIVTIALVLTGALVLSGCEENIPAKPEPTPAPAQEPPPANGSNGGGSEEKPPAETSPNEPNPPPINVGDRPTAPPEPATPPRSASSIAWESWITTLGTHRHGATFNRTMPRATGGTGDITYSLDWGTNDPGLSFSGRRVSGILDTSGFFFGTYKATDEAANSISMAVVLTVQPPPTPTTSITVTIRRSGSDTLSLREPCRRYMYNPRTFEPTHCLEAGTGYLRSEQVYTVSYSAKPKTLAVLTVDIDRRGTPCNRHGRIYLGASGYPTTTTVQLLCTAYREDYLFDSAWNALDGESVTFRNVRVDEE